LLTSDGLSKCTGFEWDEGNSEKNWLRHRVSRAECEQVFFHRPLVVYHDSKHSRSEERHYALGQTDSGRRLFMVFTVRDGLIRVISARDMNRRERGIYEEETHPQVPK